MHSWGKEYAMMPMYNVQYSHNAVLPVKWKFHKL